MLRLLTSDAEVVFASAAFIPWLVPMPIIGCAAFAWDGIYIGATSSGPIRDCTIWAVAAFFIVWFAGERVLNPSAELSPDIAVHILMAAYVVHVLVRLAYLTVLYPKSILSVPFGGIKP